VHERADDLGRGNYSDSSTTGHAGPRYGCCIIKETTGITRPQTTLSVICPVDHLYSTKW